jgi:hypothetical protein
MKPARHGRGRDFDAPPVASVNDTVTVEEDDVLP